MLVDCIDCFYSLYCDTVWSRELVYSYDCFYSLYCIVLFFSHGISL